MTGGLTQTRKCLGTGSPTYHVWAQPPKSSVGLALVVKVSHWVYQSLEAASDAKLTVEARDYEASGDQWTPQLYHSNRMTMSSKYQERSIENSVSPHSQCA